MSVLLQVCAQCLYNGKVWYEVTVRVPVDFYYRYTTCTVLSTQYPYGHSIPIYCISTSNTGSLLRVRDLYLTSIAIRVPVYRYVCNILVQVVRVYTSNCQYKEFINKTVPVGRSYIPSTYMCLFANGDCGPYFIPETYSTCTGYRYSYEYSYPPVQVIDGHLSIHHHTHQPPAV